MNSLIENEDLAGQVQVVYEVSPGDIHGILARHLPADAGHENAIGHKRNIHE